MFKGYKEEDIIGENVLGLNYDNVSKKSEFNDL